MPLQIFAKRRGRRIVLWFNLFLAIVYRLLILIPSIVLAWRFFRGVWLSPLTIVAWSVALGSLMLGTFLYTGFRLSLDGLPESPDRCDGDANAPNDRNA
jgi:hypothetical protein